MKLTLRRKPSAPESPLYRSVREAMADVRAYAHSHGGDIELQDVSQEGVVTVRLRGACKFCPLSTVTLKFGVEKALAEAVPGISKVVVHT